MLFEEKKKSVRTETLSKTPHWSNSLFVKFFISLISIALIPSALVGVFTVAAYQITLRDYVPVAETSKFTGDLITQAILVFLFITVIASFIAFRLSRSITKPLRTLTSAIERIAKEDFELSFKVTRKDEIGTLAHFFNDMVRRLKEVAERQKTISRVKSEFVTVTAHQLRTPLSAMKWSIRMLLEGDLGQISPKAKTMMERTYKSNERMITLVGDLLNVARIEEGKFGYAFHPIETNTFMNELIKEYTLHAEKKNIKIILRLPEISYTIYGDKERLELAIGNVIDNSINYTNKGKKIEVEVKLRDPNFIQIMIKDHGVGIAEEDQKRLFSKFFRAANVIKLETEGTGLGLFLTKNIILRHGGLIWFESEVNKGTIFYITLPLSPEFIPAKEPSYEEFIEAF